MQKEEKNKRDHAKIWAKFDLWSSIANRTYNYMNALISIVLLEHFSLSNRDVNSLFFDFDGRL